MRLSDQMRLWRRRGFRDNNGGCGVAMTGLMNWRQQWKCQKRKLIPKTQGRQWRHCQSKQKRRRARVNVSNGGGGGVFTGPGNQARGISDDNGGVRRGQETNDAAKGLETTTEASMIWGQQRRMRRHNGGT